MGQKITSYGSDSRRQINLANWTQRVKFSGFSGFAGKMPYFCVLSPLKAGCLRRWLENCLRFSILYHFCTFPKRINEKFSLPSVPGGFFTRKNKKRLFILFRGFRWLQTRFSGWKFKSWQICFIANKIPVVERAAGMIWHDFHASVRSKISSMEKRSRIDTTLASSLVIP